MIPRLASEYDGNARRAAATATSLADPRLIFPATSSVAGSAPRGIASGVGGKLTQIWLFVAFPFEFSHPSDQ